MGKNIFKKIKNERNICSNENKRFGKNKRPE
jgi:hypothetical protein